MIISIIGDDQGERTPTSSQSQFPDGDDMTWLELTNKWFHLLVAHGYGFLVPIEDFLEAIGTVHDNAFDKKAYGEAEKRREEQEEMDNREA